MFFLLITEKEQETLFRLYTWRVYGSSARQPGIRRDRGRVVSRFKLVIVIERILQTVRRPKNTTTDINYIRFRFTWQELSTWNAIELDCILTEAAATDSLAE